MTRCLIIDLQPLNSRFVFLDIKNLVFNLNLYETPQKHFRNLNKSISNIKIAYSHIKKNQSNKKKLLQVSIYYLRVQRETSPPLNPFLSKKLFDTKISFFYRQ
jgi:hypothetical protein